MELRQKDYTVKELAELAGVDPSRIRQLLIEKRVLKGYKRGFMWFIPAAEAKRWLENRHSLDNS